MPTTPPTQEAFDKFLSFLNPDRERAGEEFELLRYKLHLFFYSRAPLYAEELADETMNRLIKKVVEDEQIRNVKRYCYGLARWVWVEFHRNSRNKHEVINDTVPHPFAFEDRVLQDEEFRYYLHCLRKLPTQDQELVIAYCNVEEPTYYEARKDLAKKMGISPTALRIRVSRIRSRLTQCLRDCLKRDKQS